MDVSKTTPEKACKWFIEECKKLGVRVTHQRTEIFRDLAATTAHPDAETVYKRVKKKIPSISCDTVYRNLRTLAEYGLIQKVGATGYNSRFDANTSAHHHFVCTICGRIDDFECKEFEGIKLPDKLTSVGEVTSYHVEFLGKCKECCAKGSCQN